MLFVPVEQRQTPRLPEPQLWKAALGTSVAAHLAVGAALVFGLQQIRPPEPTSLSTAMAVQILPMPSAPAAPPHQTPPEPEKPKPVEQTKTEKLDLPPMPKVPNVKADVTIPPKETPPTPPKQRAAAPAAAPAAPAKAAAAPVQGTPIQGIASIEQTYDAQIVARLERRKRYPSAAMQQRMEDIVYLHMVIGRDGHIVSSDIVRSRRFPVLDDAVRELVKRVDPLPKMPKGLPGDTYTVTVPIDFFINRAR
ncbi:energy transducer TonB [Sphingobium sp. SCG-1]|uniref:energy transducer TonB n=1 Tax=Sphingobium sp. SCG-1 TaxID=2072936 RepID=UPI00166F8699|nr:energy transducer TonB [Sphingobium sp. SCG-1]